MKVVVRVRPENEREGGKRFVVRVLDEKVLLFDPKEEDEEFYYHGRKMRPAGTRKVNRDLRFMFNRVFDGHCSNHYVYQHTMVGIIDGLLEGYNCSVFAYGATGAGKTFTMLGAPGNPGLTYHTMRDLYDRIDNVKQEITCELAVSYLEVYNETIRDLITPSGLLQVREDSDRGVVVSGLSLHRPSCADDLLAMLEGGNRNRTQHPTDANAESSRSHAVFTVYVKQQDRSAGLNTNVRVAKLSLIDLAGSERAAVVNHRGARLREGANINKSLLALGNCINALADNKPSKSQHIPYRNSKLTRLLKDSLGGNCRTVMIAAVSPIETTFEDTYNTLKYADRAKNIKTDITKNVMNVDMHVSQYAKVVEDLRGQITELKTKLRVYENAPVPNKQTAAPVVIAKLGPKLTEDMKKYVGKIESCYSILKSAHRELLEQACQEKELSLKMTHRKGCQERLALCFVDQNVLDKNNVKVDHAVEQLKTKRNRVLSRCQEAETKLSQAEEALHKVTQEACLKCGTTKSVLPPPLQEKVELLKQDLELADSRIEVVHARKMAMLQRRESERNDKLTLELLKIAKIQFLLMKNQEIATSDIIADYEGMVRMVESNKSVAFAIHDQTPTAVMNETTCSEAMDQGDSEIDSSFSFDQVLRLPCLTTSRQRTYSTTSASTTSASAQSSISNMVRLNSAGRKRQLPFSALKDRETPSPLEEQDRTLLNESTVNSRLDKAPRRVVALSGAGDRVAGKAATVVTGGGNLDYTTGAMNFRSESSVSSDESLPMMMEITPPSASSTPVEPSVDLNSTFTADDSTCYSAAPTLNESFVVLGPSILNATHTVAVDERRQTVACLKDARQPRLLGGYNFRGGSMSPVPLSPVSASMKKERVFSLVGTPAPSISSETKRPMTKSFSTAGLLSTSAAKRHQLNGRSLLHEITYNANNNAGPGPVKTASDYLHKAGMPSVFDKPSAQHNMEQGDIVDNKHYMHSTNSYKMKHTRSDSRPHPYSRTSNSKQEKTAADLSKKEKAQRMNLFSKRIREEHKSKASIMTLGPSSASKDKKKSHS